MALRKSNIFTDCPVEDESAKETEKESTGRKKGNERRDTGRCLKVEKRAGAVVVHAATRQAGWPNRCHQKAPASC